MWGLSHDRGARGALIARHELPVWTPVSVGAAWRALGGRGPEDATAAQGLIARQFSATAVHFLDSGTSALSLAVQATLSRRPGAPVALPAFGCFDLVTAVRSAKADPVFYDVDPRTLAPDCGGLRRALQAGAAAVIVVHQYGLPAPIREIAALCDEHDAVLVEDAAQGVGGELEGKPLGSFGPLAVLSFGRGKGLGGGGGGALLVRGAHWESLVGDSIAGLGRPASNLGVAVRCLAQWALGRAALYGIPSGVPWLRLGETVYREPRPPHRIAPASLAVLKAGWKAAWNEAEGRRATVERLVEGLPGSVWRPIVPLKGGRPAFLRLPLIGPQHCGRPQLVWRRLGLLPSYPRILPDLPVIPRNLRSRNDFRGAYTLAERLWTAPVHGRVTGRALRELRAILLR